MPSSYAIGSHFEEFIKGQLKSGRYSSASEIIRDALRLLEEREAMREAQLASLRAQIDEGLKSGPAVQADAVFDRLEQKYHAMGD